ncbi:DUF4912 domain-containing protein [Bacillus sp. V2I10]|uniref:DUF4912 domain-containing protein n=1 Tax=Bacillus sp. V2I10 TaxID=3042276 RepID=UPI0027861B0F|nr:DUF4912 domain-containing protein [Bacillus sp. V2I10]MDQ0858381.1 hypothetical protein [Bacillus sp. V2I10]
MVNQTSMDQLNHLHGDAMTLIMKNPSVLYLQWNVGFKTEIALSILCREPFSSLKKTLRLYQIKKSSLYYKDFKIKDEHTYLFIEGIGAASSYYTELILHTSENVKLTVLKSNELKMTNTDGRDTDWTAYKGEPESWEKQFSAYTVYDK